MNQSLFLERLGRSRKVGIRFARVGWKLAAAAVLGTILSGPGGPARFMVVRAEEAAGTRPSEAPQSPVVRAVIPLRRGGSNLLRVSGSATPTRGGLRSTWGPTSSALTRRWPEDLISHWPSGHGSRTTRALIWCDWTGWSWGPCKSDRAWRSRRDLRGLRERLGVDVSGVLDWPLLRQYPIAIDFDAPGLTVYDSNRFVPPRSPAREEQVRWIDEVPTIRGRLGTGQTGWFALDASLRLPFRLSRRFTDYHPEVFLEQPQPSIAIGDGVVPRFESFEILGRVERGCQGLWEGPTHKSGNYVPEEDLPRPAKAGDVGGPLLRGLRLTFDAGAGRIWVERRTDVGVPRGRVPDEADLAGVAPTIRAAGAGDRAAVAELLGKGADVNAADSGGGTALAAASAGGHLGVVKLLLDHGATPDVRDRKGRTPLMHASAGGFVDAAKALVASGAKADATDEAGRSALHYAASGDQAAVVDLLAAGGADVNRRAVNGLSPLAAAADLGCATPWRRLLRAHVGLKDLVDDSDDFGRAALKDAAVLNRVGVVRQLLAAGAAADAKSPGGRTALMWAARSGSADVARLLLDAGADPRAASSDGRTVLDYTLEAVTPDVADLVHTALRREPLRGQRRAAGGRHPDSGDDAEGRPTTFHACVPQRAGRGLDAPRHRRYRVGGGQGGGGAVPPPGRGPRQGAHRYGGRGRRLPNGRRRVAAAERRRGGDRPRVRGRRRSGEHPTGTQLVVVITRREHPTGTQLVVVITRRVPSAVPGAGTLDGGCAVVRCESAAYPPAFGRLLRAAAPAGCRRPPPGPTRLTTRPLPGRGGPARGRGDQARPVMWATPSPLSNVATTRRAGWSGSASRTAAP